MDHIVWKLDEISDRLDSIRQNQWELYEIIADGNRRTEHLMGSIANDMDRLSASNQAIKANSEIIAYNTERTQKELEYNNRMHYLLGDYDEISDNQLPR